MSTEMHMLATARANIEGDFRSGVISKEQYVREMQISNDFERDLSGPLFVNEAREKIRERQADRADMWFQVGLVGLLILAVIGLCFAAKNMDAKYAKYDRVNQETIAMRGSL